jgi:PAS domain S-box-containing protein
MIRKRQFILVLMLSIVVVLVVGAVAVKYNSQVLSDIDHTLAQNSENIRAAAELQYHIETIHAAMTKLLVEKSERTPAEEKQLSRKIAKSVISLRTLIPLIEPSIKLAVELGAYDNDSQSDVENFEKLTQKIVSLIPLVEKTLQYLTSQDRQTAVSFFRDTVEQPLREARTFAADLEITARRSTTDNTRTITLAVRNTAWMSAVLAAAAIGSLTVLGYVLCKMNTRPLIRPILASPHDKTLANETMGQGTNRTQTGPKSFKDIKPGQDESASPQTSQPRQPPTPSAPVTDHLLHDDDSTQVKLQRRISQLDCLYALSKLIERSNTTLEQIFTEAVPLIHAAYQHPRLTCARITFDGIHYKTDNFEKTEISQCAAIRIRSKEVGAVEVYYIGPKNRDGSPSFLDSERAMLDAVAEHLAGVAETKKSAEKLQLFRSLIDRSNDSIFVMEPKWGRILDVNDRASEMLQYSRAELLDMTIKDIDEQIPDDSAWQSCVKDLTEKGDITLQGRHKSKNDDMLFVETSFRLVAHGKQNYIIAATRDISERKTAEANQAKLITELKATNDRVRRINQELKEFAYVVSHDLKAPLRGIKTLADWISSDYGDKLDENGKEQIRLLQTRVERMHSLIEGVLQYSRVGRVREKEIIVDLNLLLPEIIDMVAPPQNIRITVDTPMPVIRCEKTSIIRVFENLLSNAIKYIDKPEGLVGITCRDDNEAWTFSVTDNGPGIEKKYFEKIFKIFQTLAPRDEYESTGIGLTVVKKIVELNGGSIWVESIVGQGSTFSFTMPKSKCEVKNAKPEAHIAC